MMHVFGSTKTYTHSVGLSCAFRQHRATSHCRFIHGYALKVTLDFIGLPDQHGVHGLDENGWVVNFGGLKEIKAWLEDTFDHRLVVAADDPELDTFHDLHALGVAQVKVVPKVGCEAFAKHIFDYVDAWTSTHYGHRIRLRKVTVAEHEGNSAYYEYLPHTGALRLEHD